MSHDDTYANEAFLREIRAQAKDRQIVVFALTKTEAIMVTAFLIGLAYGFILG